jgi:hypothetical protein
MDFSWLINQQSTAVFVGLRKRERTHLLQALDSLAKNPYPEMTGSFQDSKGRVFNIKQFGEFVITYFVDDPVRQIQIVDLVKV